jgi:hypothetical protein
MISLEALTGPRTISVAHWLKIDLFTKSFRMRVVNSDRTTFPGVRCSSILTIIFQVTSMSRISFFLNVPQSVSKPVKKLWIVIWLFAGIRFLCTWLFGDKPVTLAGTRTDTPVPSGNILYGIAHITSYRMTFRLLRIYKFE